MKKTSRRSVLQVCALSGVIIAVAACQDELPTAQLVGSSDSSHYYLYQDQRVPLDVEDGYLVVSSSAASDLKGIVRAIGEVAGLELTATGPSPAPDHRIFRVAGGLGRTQAALNALRSSPSLDFVSRVYQLTGTNDRFIPLNQIDIQFHADASADAIRDVTRRHGLTEIRTARPDSGRTWYSYRYSRAADPLLASSALSAEPAVKWASPDAAAPIHPAQDPTDPFFSSQWHFRNRVQTLYGKAVDINVVPAWGITKGSSAIRVAVIDDGIDVQQWNNTTGYEGDMMSTPIAGGKDYVSDPSRLFEDAWNPCCADGHGTAVAGIIFANHDNGRGGAGIAPGTSAIAIRIYRAQDTPNSEMASASELADAITWAWYALSADVLNLSWKYPPSSALSQAISNATTLGRNGKGAVVVAAAGNNSDRASGYIASTVFPASLSASTSTISVGAIDRDGSITNYSPGSGPIDLVALSNHFTGDCGLQTIPSNPAILTTDRMAAIGCNNGGDNTLQWFGGTSAATPQAAGVAALMLSVNSALTASAVKSLMKAAAAPWGASSTFGAGKLDAYNAVVAALPPPPPPPPPFVVDIIGPTSVKPNSTCHYVANVVSGGGGPYTFSWTVGKTKVGIDQEIDRTAGSTSYTLSLTVRDPDLNRTSESVSISVSSSAPSCMDQ